MLSFLTALSLSLSLRRLCAALKDVKMLRASVVAEPSDVFLFFFTCFLNHNKKLKS